MPFCCSKVWYSWLLPMRVKCLYPSTASACDLRRLHSTPLQGYVEPPDGPAPPATLASAQRLAAQLVSSPTRVLLLKNMLRAGQLQDDEERKDVRARSLGSMLCNFL